MKQIILAITLLFITGVGHTQNKEKRIKFESGTLAICSSSQMSFKGHDGDEVIIRNLSENIEGTYFYNYKDGQENVLRGDTLLVRSFRLYDGQDKKEDLEKGLKPLGNTSTNPADNLYLDIVQKPGQLIIRDYQSTQTGSNQSSKSYSLVSMNNKYEILIPHSVKLMWNSQGCQKKNSNTFFLRTDSNPWELSDFKGEAEISTSYKSIKLTNVTGPVIANTIGGNITVVFDKTSPKKLYSLVSNSGYIDVTLPSNSSIKINATGDRILSNIDFKILVETVNNLSKHMELQLNSGNAKMKIDAGSGSIYLRDSK